MAKKLRPITKKAIKAKDNPFAKYVGVLKTFPGGIKEINAWVRDLRDEK